MKIKLVRNKQPDFEHINFACDTKLSALTMISRTTFFLSTFLFDKAFLTFSHTLRTKSGLNFR
jgi:hypothetical protein